MILKNLQTRQDCNPTLGSPGFYSQSRNNEHRFVGNEENETS